MTGETGGRDLAAVYGHRWSRPTAQRLRAALLLLWVASSMVAWWMAPRPATVDQALADLASGAAVAYRWAGGYVSSTSGPGADGELVNLSHGEHLVWRTDDWRVHYATLGPDGAVADSLLPEPGEPTEPGEPGEPTEAGEPTEDPAIRALAPAVARAFPGGSGTPHPWPMLSTAVGLLFLGALVYGPPPRTGTRWYWFWIGAGTPLGLGLVAWLLWEHPWAPDVVERQRRRRGLTGFLLALGLAIGGGLLLSLVRGAAAGWLIPPIPPF